jgi:hypothetical protein
LLEEESDISLQDIEGEAIETPGDMDLGLQLIMKPRTRHRPFRVFGTLDTFYTDNVGLSNSNRQADTYLFTEVGGRYEERINEALGVEVTVRQAIFRYDDLTGFDFESMNAGAGLGYTLSRLADITLFTRYNCERLTNNDFGDEMLLNHTLTFGAQKNWIYQETNSFYAGSAAIFGFGHPSDAERDEYCLFGGAHWQLTPCVDADLYGRLSFFDFDSGQHDFNSMIVPTLTWHIHEQCDLTFSLSLVYNDSNRSRFDYHAVTTGGGINLILRF